MAQPEYVPLVTSDRVRPSSRLSIPGHWSQDRPAELTSLRQPVGANLGATGSDLGFGLKLAKRVAQRAVLSEGEDIADAIAGGFAAGTRRSSMFHRSPVIYDMEWAFTLWGFFPGPPKTSSPTVGPFSPVPITTITGSGPLLTPLPIRP